MEEQLRSFLEECKVSKGELFTHTTKGTGSLSEGWTSGSYYIDNDYIEIFYTYYCNSIYKNKLTTITERPGPYGPLRVDFDFKTSLDHGQKRQYTTDILKKIITLYQEELVKIISPSDFEEKMLWSIVLEKPKPRVEEGIIKDGFHIHFPYFICEGWLQDEYLRNKVTSRMIEEKVWNGSKFTTPINEIIDKNMAKKPWMMYGSVNYKNNKSVPYIYNRWDKTPVNERYGHAFDSKLNEIHLHTMFEDEMVGRPKKIKYYLPRFFSIRGFHYPTSLTDDMIKKQIINKGLNKKKKNQTITKKRREADVMEDIKTIKDGELMSMISDDRSENHDEWIDVGWTLFNIGQGSDECLEMWIDFSRRSSKFVEGECEERWESMEIKGKTIASLLAMAKTDSPNEYKAWKDTNIRFYLWASLQEPKPTEYDVGMVVTKMFGDKFICSNAKHNEWYYFEDHRWREMDNGIQMKLLFVNEVIVEYVELQREINKEAADIEYKMGLADKDSTTGMELAIEYKKITMKKKKCTAVISELKTVKFHKKLIEMCQMNMHDPQFHRKRDENRYLLGCENGVIDLEFLVFRDGRPDDYVTFSTGLYYQTFNEGDEEVTDLNDMLMKIYPNENLRKYFVDFFCFSMKGGNSGKDWLIATGESDGGKSQTFKLIELVYGCGKIGYAGKFSRENFIQATGRNSSAGPRPDLSRIRGKRLMGGQEITKDEKVNIGFIKEITGNDSIWARGMYEKDAEEISPQFTLYAQLNVAPDIPGDDEAFWSRVRKLDHESKFVIPDKLKQFPVPATFEEQFKMKRFNADPEFGETLKDKAVVLLWKLFERYKELIRLKQKVVRPKEVLLSTELYKSNNDIYLRFIRDRIEKEEDLDKVKSTFITYKEMSIEFNEWYKEEYPSYSKDKIGRTILIKEINKKLGVIYDPEKDVYGYGKQSRWWGYKIIQKDEEEEDSFDDLLGKN
jgi:phage/plasmid-associated DNA primase